jgi:hypothetical protein
MGRALPFLRTITRQNRDGSTVQVNEYKCGDCSNCPLADNCLNKNAKARRISRDQYEYLREELAERMKSEEGKQAYSKRAPLVEGVFGVIKGGFGIRQFLTRGRNKVRAEWRWVCASYNITRLLGLLKEQAKA